MFGEKKDHHTHPQHLSNGNPESSQIDFLRDSKMGLDGFSSKPQELTLSYLCENPKFIFGQKGKEVIVSETSNHDDKWVERDFMNLSETKSNSSSKRVIQEDERGDFSREKKPKLETLNLSLALPDVSLSLTASNALQNVDPVVNKPNPSCSNDFTAASLSYSYSHQFSHNPSCSLTRNSTENYDYSLGRDDQIWCGGEGTNGSVHSRFRPIGDGLVALNNNVVNGGGAGGGGGGGNSMVQSHRNTSVYMATSSDNISFFPSELPARPRLDAHSGDSRRKESDNLRGLEGLEGVGRGRKVSRPERILREIVSESIPIVAQIIQELSEEMLETIKEYLNHVIVMPDKRDELLGLQSCLSRRSDLTKEALSKCQKGLLEIFVSVKMGLSSFISGKVKLPPNELVEIFLNLRCRNVICKSMLPVDDCDCKFCSANKGFCSSCMCPVCMKFDCANNTCSWVGCDVCSHWCHAACGIQKNLIRSGPSLKGPKGTSEMQFHCIGCNHASEMFGFVKDVFVYCAKDWGLQTLIRELDCVRKIFKASEDYKGKQLFAKSEELLSKLDSKTMSPSDACNIIIHFFDYPDSIPEIPTSSTVSAKELMPTETTLRKDVVPVPPATSLPPKYSMYNMSSAAGRHGSLSLSNDHRNDLKDALLGDLKIEDDFQFGNLSKKDGLDSLESIVRIKEAEARMFQSKADEARREAEGYRRMIRAKSEKLEEEYTGKLAKLCLQETEEMRRKKLDELKVLENSHCDYYNMKLRMQAEISGLLERMEATKQQIV
ncbi:hypothetical protein M5689_015018 [Euphorbia peplus]|nr:hypothetical protein M5689_015018 [Euphorbia peplus]